MNLVCVCCLCATNEIHVIIVSRLERYNVANVGVMENGELQKWCEPCSLFKYENHATYSHMNNGFSDACQTSTAPKEPFSGCWRESLYFFPNSARWCGKFTRLNPIAVYFRCTNLPHIYSFSPLLHSNTDSISGKQHK